MTAAARIAREYGRPVADCARALTAVGGDERAARLSLDLAVAAHGPLFARHPGEIGTVEALAAFRLRRAGS
jgi:hypothetical protein